MPHFALQAMALVMLLQAIQVPPPVGFVNDFAGVISSDTRERLTLLIEDVRARSGGEIAVVTLADVGRRSESDVAREIGRQWKVGKAAEPGDPARNAGVVVLVVPKETNSDGRGRCRIETGRGVEGFITDSDAGSICRRAISFFQRRDYSGGIQYMVGAIAAEYAREFGFTLSGAAAPSGAAPPRDSRSDESKMRAMVVGIAIGLFFLAVFALLVRSARHEIRSSRARRGRPAALDPLLWAVLSSSTRHRGSNRGSSHDWGIGGGGGGGFGGGFGGGGFGGFGGGGGFSGGGGGGSW